MTGLDMLVRVQKQVLHGTSKRNLGNQVLPYSTDLSTSLTAQSKPMIHQDAGLDLAIWGLSQLSQGSAWTTPVQVNLPSFARAHPVELTPV